MLGLLCRLTLGWRNQALGSPEQKDQHQRRVDDTLKRGHDTGWQVQEADGLWMGQVELMDADPEIPLAKEHEKVAALLHEIISIIKSEDLLGDHAFIIPEDLDDCGWVSNRLAELLPISLAQKNHLLAQTNPRIRLDLITEIIEDDDLRNLKMH
mgnify:CR=1 FL=1